MRVLNPALREGVQIYFVEGQGFTVYLTYLAILAALQLLILFLPTLDPQGWMGSANLFKFSSVAALILTVYFTLRFANQEFVPWRFLPLKHWLHKEGLSPFAVAAAQLSLLCLQALLFLLLSLPLLTWAGAVARAAPESIVSTFPLLFFYSLAYGVWGTTAATLWERRVESRQVFIRCFFAALLFFSSLLYLPLNPAVFLFAHLGGRELAPLVVWGWQWSAGTVHGSFHLFLLASGLIAYRWALKREGYL
ncbi:MAG: hypothetical protein ACREP8_10790 [Candidatus Binatia bacterium]